jgi:translation elongation factor EF-Ts
MKTQDKEYLVKELKRRTDKGKMACDISLSLSGYDMEKAIKRMKSSYPSMEVKK